ncbi:DUF2274 domain-containing protein [Pseudacidovorax sp. RU35E]|uniref:DUF2274 domain-containing protein n=1 Tax=Pseudacidovorax sp. RU35E TaxID=1907403 RepID=UPI00117B94A4
MPCEKRPSAVSFDRVRTPQADEYFSSLLVPHILAAFIARDRGFRSARKKDKNP